jgi:hypothetical integral membrane protein (TIGR02206 family)
MPLFGQVHLLLLLGIAAAAALVSAVCRGGRIPGRTVRLALGFGLAVNELAWWAFRYSHEGLHLGNLPLQLCDLTVWATVLACLRPSPWIVEFAYLSGMAGAGMALITPDLWSPWPTYPAIYFFAAHGGIIVAVAALVFGGEAHPGTRPPWRAFGLLLAYAAVIGIFDAITGTNYMYLCRKPKAVSLLDAFGPWPIYLAGGAATALAIFWLLWLPLRAAWRPVNATTGRHQRDG